MKRKLFIAGATFVLAAAAITAIAANQQTNEPTLLEANIEALGANGPGGGEGGGGSNTNDCYKDATPPYGAYGGYHRCNNCSGDLHYGYIGNPCNTL